MRDYCAWPPQLAADVEIAEPNTLKYLSASFVPTAPVAAGPPGGGLGAPRTVSRRPKLDYQRGIYRSRYRSSQYGQGAHAVTTSQQPPLFHFQILVDQSQ